MVEVAEVEGRVPSVKALLEAKVPIIVKELLSEQAEISVYQNGFVLYRVGKRATVFPLHSCKEYIYDSNIEALTNINERFFDNENWYIRLILEGEDRLVKNQEVRNGKKTISYSAVAEDWNELREEDSTLAHLILCETGVMFWGGSGYDLENRLPEEIEHCYPDYSLYPKLTKDTAYGFLTRGCPRKNHTFCITPRKDGHISRKVADLSEFWDGQKNIVLLDQNLLACKERMELLYQLSESKARVDFNGGMDVRFLNGDVIEALRKIRVKEYHFAWDDPREKLQEKFRLFKRSGLKSQGHCRVYVLTNYWSSIEEDLFRIATLRELGFFPFVMIYDKQRFVYSRGRWLPHVAEQFTERELRHFKICQHMQRWCGQIQIFNSCPRLEDYEPYKKWVERGMPIPI